MSDSAQTTTPGLRVFLSYSRVDTGFVDELAAGLPLVGNFDVTLDRHSIESGVDWKERLRDLIEEADAVVFVLSPEFARSKECAWEVEMATALGKRLVPVLYRALGDAVPPHPLGKINFVDATAAGTLIDTLKTLGQTLRTDLGWLKQSTRFLNLAQDWDQAGRPDNRLLMAIDIDAATEWLENVPGGVEITDLQREFVNASTAAFALRHDEEQRRLAEVADANARAAAAAQRGRLRALAGAAASVVLAVVAGYAYLMAKEAEDVAWINVQLADQERKGAQEARAVAQKALREAEFVVRTMVASTGFQETGFDCEKSLTLERPIEFMICASPALAEQDRLLSAQYFNLYGKLADGDKDKLKSEQRMFIRARSLDCVPDFGKPITEEHVLDAILCAKDRVRWRNEQLSQHLMVFDKLGRLGQPEELKLIAD